MLSWSTTHTPVGPFTAVVNDTGAVLATGWTTDPDALVPLISPGLRQPLQHRQDLGPVTEAVHRYFAGELDALDGIQVEQRASDFLEHAWRVLRKVPPGEPVSYTEYAHLAGRPKAVRAAATACARNAAALFVPCHRVVRSDGTLGGFRWGLEVKQQLLDHERRAA